MRCNVLPQEAKVGEMIAEGTPEVVGPACAEICTDSGGGKKKKRKASKKKASKQKKQKKKTKQEV